jgi:predicted regulator of Ras-like GTPase activity (Roadblock/LC7/MglB family)
MPSKRQTRQLSLRTDPNIEVTNEETSDETNNETIEEANEAAASQIDSRPVGSLVVSEPDNRRIGEQLDKLVSESGASATLLLDKSGEVIAARGEVLSQDLTMLGALLAGTFATSREIARMMNETSFRSLFQQGMKLNMLTEMVGEGWIVVVLFDKSTHVGLVRDLCRQVTPQLEAVLLQVQRQSRIVSGLNPAFRTSVEDTIDLLFKD